MEDVSNGGNRGPVVVWYQNRSGNWDIRFADNEVGQLDDELANWLLFDGGVEYFAQVYIMSFIFRINSELCQRVVEENRILTKAEIAGVMDDLSDGIIRKANEVLELRKWCELELANLGEPCSVVIDKCRRTSRLAITYVGTFWRLEKRLGKSQGGKYFWTQGGKYFWTQVLSDALIKFNKFIMSTDGRMVSSPLDVFTFALGLLDLDDESEWVKFVKGGCGPILVEQALGNALKMLDYIQAVFNEMHKTIDPAPPAPDLVKENRLDEFMVEFAEMSKPRPVVADNDFLVLVALYELNQAVGVRFVKNKANELGGSFIIDNDVSKRCSILNKEFGFASTTKHKWSITETGRAYVEVDLRFETLNHSR